MPLFETTFARGVADQSQPPVRSEGRLALRSRRRPRSQELGEWAGPVPEAAEADASSRQAGTQEETGDNCCTMNSTPICRLLTGASACWTVQWRRAAAC